MSRSRLQACPAWSTVTLRTAGIGVTAVLAVQSSVAATAAWLLASAFTDGHVPLFAPIAAAIALNAAYTERLTTVLHLIMAVLIGIGSAELSLMIIGNNPLAFVTALMITLIAARIASRDLLVLNEGSASAVITLVTAQGSPGLERIGDALIGASVALIFTLVVFVPEPVKLVRRAESEVLSHLSAGCRDLVRALDRSHPSASAEALRIFDAVQGELASIRRVRELGTQIARRSVLWRRRRRPLAFEIERADHLDRFASTMLIFARRALADPHHRPERARSTTLLVAALSRLAADPMATEPREKAAHAGIDAYRLMASVDHGSTATLALRALVMDLADLLDAPADAVTAALDAPAHQPGTARVTVPEIADEEQTDRWPSLRYAVLRHPWPTSDDP